MVILKSTLQKLAIPLAVTSLLILDSCSDSKDDATPETKTDLLIGDWELTESDGDDYTGYDESIIFKFKSNGDWQFCYEYDSTPSDNDCYDGTWKWESSDEETILMEGLDSSSSFKFDVVVLTDTKLEGTIASTYDGGTYTYTTPVKFVKIK